MKIEKTEISALTQSLVSVVKRTGPYFKAPLHYHPEIELVYVLKSSGKRIIGNKVEHFDSGDMIFLGSDLPHVWLNDASYFQGNKKMHAEAIVAYFNTNVFSSFFYENSRTSQISNLFNKAKKGIRITGETRRCIAQILPTLVAKKDLELLPGLFEILTILANSDETVLINNDAFALPDDAIISDRLNEVLNFVKNNFHKIITLDEVAKMAKLTPQSFSRLFKTKTNKNFTEYLLETRISNACTQILQTDKRIADIANDCGFNNLSNFNRQFKKITNETPMRYKSSRQLRQ